VKNILIIIMGVLLTVLSGENGSDKENIYAGVQRCKVCHETDEMGNQYAVWKLSQHANAYKTLLTEESAQIAKSWGLSLPAQESPECLKCHVTGYNNSKAEFGKKFNNEDGVQCESCHGPGESYRKENIMCDRDLSKANGLILPKPEDCLTCHNEESPRYKTFSYESYYEKMKHKKNPDFNCTSDDEEDEDW
jgi:hypothetical protein